LLPAAYHTTRRVVPPLLGDHGQQRGALGQVVSRGDLLDEAVRVAQVE
jgi:hypothetical protein